MAKEKQATSRKTVERKPQSHYTTHVVPVSYDEAENIANHIQPCVQKKLAATVLIQGAPCVVEKILAQISLLFYQRIIARYCSYPHPAY